MVFRLTRIRPLRTIIVLSAFALELAGAVSSPGQDLQPNAIPPTITFNQKMIEGLQSGLQIEDTTAVFRAVFFALDDEVVVYPTENYYYFQIYARGETIWGNLRLDARDRDEGTIHLGYFEYDENGRHQDREGWDKAFSAADGVAVKRVDNLVYSVTYSGRSVTFRLNDISAEKPDFRSLTSQETFVGPIFDESGLKFFLLFNRKARHLLYMLNERGYVPEHFVSASDEIVIGQRTGFGFYLDTRNNRKILIGAHGRSVDPLSLPDALPI